MSQKIPFNHPVQTSSSTSQIIAIERMCTFYICIIKHKLTSFCFQRVHKLPTVLIWNPEEKEGFFFLSLFIVFSTILRMCLSYMDQVSILCFSIKIAFKILNVSFLLCFSKVKKIANLNFCCSETIMEKVEKGNLRGQGHWYFGLQPYSFF